MDPFETLTATQSPVDPFGTPPATPRPAAEVADFVNALWSRGGARGARHWSAEGATGGEHASAGGACSLADGGVAGVRAERATGAPKARRAERASAQAEHAGTRWSHRRSADNFTVQRSAHPQAPCRAYLRTFVLNKATYKNVYEGTTYTCTKVLSKVLSYSCTLHVHYTCYSIFGCKIRRSFTTLSYTYTCTVRVRVQ